jgi:hypothetical protein
MACTSIEGLHRQAGLCMALVLVAALNLVALQAGESSALGHDRMSFNLG